MVGSMIFYIKKPFLCRKGFLLERTAIKNGFSKVDPFFDEVEGFSHVFLIYSVELSIFKGLNQSLYILLLYAYIFTFLEKGVSVSISIEIVHIVI